MPYQFEPEPSMDGEPDVDSPMDVSSWLSDNLIDYEMLIGDLVLAFQLLDHARLLMHVLGAWVYMW